MEHEQSEADKRFVQHVADCRPCGREDYCETGYRLHEAAVNERVRQLRAER